MMVKRLISFLLTGALMCSMVAFSSTATAATDDSASTGSAFFNQNKYADQIYNGDDLGFTYTAEATTWKVWSPAAESVQLKLYKTGTDRENGAGVIGVYDLEKNASFATNGVWEVTLEGDYKNIYYTYLVKVANTNGVVETNETQDIYSKAVGANGDRSMVVDLDDTDPEGWDTDEPHVLFDDFSKTAVWELHIRDFSCDPESGISEENQGNYLAFTEGGTTLKSDSSAESIKTGIDYLVEQGINCVQLMPFADYDQVDEINGDSATKRNWGYNPKNYNVPDGVYSSNAYDGNVRINETKQMIQALHDRGISVIMDVVYNHTAGYEASCFTKTVPGYYYRMMSAVQYADGSGQGCELASENQMTRNFILQSLKYWVEEYHIDGFRFDLMACIDVTTLNQAREMINALYDGEGAKIPMYGEPWAGGISLCTDPAVPSNASRMLKGVGMFEANMRDAATNITNATASNWVMGTADSRAGSVATGIKADHINSSYNNTQTVNYAECHDNMALWDQITGAYTKKGEGKASITVATNVNSTDEKYVDQLKLAGALFLTSQGITFMQSGTEFARTKQGQHNSYNSSDEINQLDWSRLVQYGNVAEYYKGLNRINDVYSPFSDDTEASEDTIKFIRTDGVIAYTIDNVTENAANEWGKVAVLLNSTSSNQTIDLGASGWVVVADGNNAGVKSLGTVDGSSYTVEANSAAVLVEKTSYKDFSDNYKFGTLTTNHYVNGELKNTTTATYKVGTTYHALKDSDLLIDNVIDKVEGTTVGTFTGDTTVNYYYKASGKQLGTLTVNYVDRDGFKVTPTMSYVIEAGTEYNVPVCAVQGYQLNTNKYPANTTGTFSGEDKEITFVYKELDSQVVTMHYNNTRSDWRSVLCYAYTDDGDEPLGAWQASRTNKTATMQADPEMGDNWFKIDIPVASCKVMFYSTSSGLGQEPGQNEPGYAVAGECWVQNKQVTYDSTIITSCIDIDTGVKVGQDTIVTQQKKNTDTYTTSFEKGTGTLVSTPANAAGFYQPGVTNVVYLFKDGTPIPTEDEPEPNENRYLLGDANCDGEVNIIDVTYIQQYIVNLAYFDDYNIRNADVDGNYIVNIKDASYIQRYCVSMDVDYQIGRYFRVDSYQKPTEPEDEVQLNTVLFTDSKNWSSQLDGALYCYWWTDEDGAAAEWPGVLMESVGKNEYNENQFSIDLPYGANFIINNTYVQTVDLKYFGETGFYPSTMTDGKYECGSW